MNDKEDQFENDENEESLNDSEANINNASQMSPNVTCHQTSSNVTPEINFDVYSEIDEVDKAIIKMKLEFPTMPDKEIAKRLNINPRTIIRRQKKFKFQKAFGELQKPALQILLDAQTAAARELVKISQRGNNAEKLRACCEILTGVLTENHKHTLEGKIALTKEMLKKEVDETMKMLEETEV